MPTKARRERLQAKQELNALFDAVANYAGLSTEQTEVARAQLFEYLDRVDEKEKTRRTQQLLSYQLDNNTKQKVDSVLRRAKLAFEYQDLLYKPHSARWVATQIKNRGIDKRTIEAIAIDVNCLRKWRSAKGSPS